MSPTTRKIVSQLQTMLDKNESQNSFEEDKVVQRLIFDSTDEEDTLD